MMIRPRVRKNIYFDYDIALVVNDYIKEHKMTFSYFVNMVIRKFIEEFESKNENDEVDECD